jgi:hypothetical protein
MQAQGGIEVENGNGLESLADGPEPEGSPLADLRQFRADLAKDRTHDIPVAGYHGRLVARYRILDPNDDGRLGKKAANTLDGEDFETAVNVWADELIAGCVGVFAKGSGQEEKLAEGWHVDLAPQLGFEAETARETVKGVFNNHRALSAHHDQYLAWLRGNGDRPGALQGLDEEALGE